MDCVQAVSSEPAAAEYSSASPRTGGICAAEGQGKSEQYFLQNGIFRSSWLAQSRKRRHRCTQVWAHFRVSAGASNAIQKRPKASPSGAACALLAAMGLNGKASYSLYPSLIDVQWHEPVDRAEGEGPAPNRPPAAIGQLRCGAVGGLPAEQHVPPPRAT